MADKTNQLIMEALSRAIAEPAGLPLFGSKSAGGLFAAGAPAKQAAQRCVDEQFLRPAGTQKRGKAEVEIWAPTEKGLAFLMSQVSPRHVLEDLVRAVEARQQQIDNLVASARQTQDSIDALRATTEKVLLSLGSTQPAIHPTNGRTPGTNGNNAPQVSIPPPWLETALTKLATWQAARPTEDCSLPELYGQVLQTGAQPTIGEFHDGLRRLHEEGRIYLHPWTGPLYDLPEPPFALLAGHEIAYYASIRK